MIVKWGRIDRIILVVSVAALVIGVVLCATAVVAIVAGLH